MKQVNLMLLLEQLENLIEDSPRVPLTGKSLIATDDLYDILDQLRVSLPEEVKRAEWVSKEKERLLDEGRAEAQKMVEQAKEYIQNVIDESEILRLAKEEAAAVVETAQEEADRIAQGASDYGQEVLATLEVQLERVLETVRRGQAELNKK